MGFESCDYIITPTSPIYPPKIGSSSVVENYLIDIFTILPSLASFSAITIPIHGKGELPMGVQIIFKG